jgi:hypothetical protein
MSIKQFNGSYLPQEDRILFCFNTFEKAEYKLWFTRRVTLFILAATSHLWARKFEQTHTPEAAKALTDFQRDAVKEAQAPNQVYEGGAQFPIGASPLLVIEINCALTKEGEGDKVEDVLSIDFVLPGGASLNLKMGGETLQAMCLLLEQMRQQAKWSEPLFAAAVPEESEKPTPSKFH